MRGYVLFLLSMLTAWTVYGQTRSVQGMLKDDKNRMVAGATVTLTSRLDSMSTGSSMAGIFTFDKIKADTFKITVSNLGFERFEQEFHFPQGQQKYVIPSLTLQQNSQMLEEVVVDGVPTVVVKSDTLEYTMKDLKLREGSVAEDALKKLQGVEVDKDGNVTAQGESVKRVRINGKDFFGGDLKTATQNLPANIIQKMQIIDDYGEMANITGNKNGESEKVLNIQIDPKYNQGHMTTLRAGYGTEDRYQATGMWMGMREGEQLSVLGNLNNTNAPLFDFNTTGGGARRGQGGGGRRGGGMFGGSDGLTKIGSIGLNFRKDFNDKLTAYGSYSYSHTDNTTLSERIQENTLPSIMQTDSISNRNNTVGGSHRFEANVEWKPSDKDYIKISPQFGFDKSDATTFSESTTYRSGALNNTQTQDILANSTAPRFGISGLYNRKLNDKGRNVFVNMNYNNAETKKDQDAILDRLLADPNNAGVSLTKIYEKTILEAKNKSWNAGASLNYTEPLSEKGRLEFTYDFNKNKYDNSNKQTGYDANGNLIAEDPKLNFDYNYDYSFATHKVGANYLYNGDKITYSIGAAAQPSQLRGDAISSGLVVPIHRNNMNWMPIARFEYKFSRQSNLSVNYSGTPNEPSVTQILPFDMSTNRTSIVIGNANLNPEFSHQLNVRFRKNDFQKGNNFFAFVNAGLTNNKIVSLSKSYLDDLMDYQTGKTNRTLVSETRYLNETGDKPFNVSSFYHYGKSLKEKTYNIMLMGGISYNKNIGYVSTEKDDNMGQKNVARNIVFNQGLMFRYNPSENLEINPGVRYQYNHTENSLTNRTTNVSSWTPTLIGSVNITPTTIFGADLSKQFNNGYGAGINANPFVINSYIEQKFLKERRGTIRLQAFDLLNQQTNVSRTVSESMITDSRTNRLGRYFMLLFTYKFQKFAMGNPQGEDRFPGGMRRPRM
ncbi:TonB-dependent receptor [Sphingobacterium thalpophilum]|uniref:TonB-dependent receptor n=1 Tax=Sphingobacterium thalpophilum TaxID=259 RepID=A0ABV4HFU7_9SPHI|nr:MULTISPECIES: TonB-dependent receptor [Sphingobacterium]